MDEPGGGYAAANPGTAPQQLCSRLSPCLGAGSQRPHPVPCTGRSDHPIPSHPGAAVPSWSPACSQGSLPGARVFGCKQSSGESQALVFVCLRLLRQLGASRELPKSSVARAKPPAQLPWGGVAGRAPLSGQTSGQRGSGRSVHQHNQTGAQCGGGLLQSRVTAWVCSILWFGLHEGSGRPLPVARQH